MLVRRKGQQKINEQNTLYRERDEKEEERKVGGRCEAVMNEEKKKPEQRGRQ